MFEIWCKCIYDVNVIKTCCNAISGIKSNNNISPGLKTLRTPGFKTTYYMM